jgi:uncharacterized protein YqgC (DUF456 family)
LTDVLSILVVAVLKVRAVGNALALFAGPPVLWVGTCCYGIGYSAVNVSDLLAVIVIVVAVVALALRGRGCALTLAFGRSGSDGWRWTALRRVRHVGGACDE